MFLLQLSIILQLTGALDAFAGVILCLIGFKGGLSSGLLLMGIGTFLFLSGRILLGRANRRRSAFTGAPLPGKRFVPHAHLPYEPSEPNAPQREGVKFF
jgi:hypothetical protein